MISTRHLLFNDSSFKSNIINTEEHKERFVHADVTNEKANERQEVKIITSLLLPH